MSEFEHLKSQLTLGRLSRRNFLGSSFALGLSATAMNQALAAAEDAAPPKKGGLLTLGLSGGSASDSLDIRTFNDTIPATIGFALYNGLVENGPDNRPIPELAESYEASNGAKTWTFNLRKGVPFSNGKEFDADDAIYSINLHRGETKSGASATLKGVTDLKKLGKYQIEITLASGNADFPISLTDYHILMVPNGFTDWAKPIGTGAFKMGDFQPGIRIVLDKAGTYWKENRGHLDRVVILVVNDPGARTSALLSKQVDIINSVDPKTLTLLQRNPSVEVVQAHGGWFPDMAMQIDKAPFDNLDYRKALKYAVDRERMVKTLFGGFGVPGNDNPIPPSDPYFNSELEQLKFDPDKAKFHFQKSGLSDAKIALQTSDGCFNGAVDMGVLLQASAKDCGIPIDVKRESADGYFGNVWLNGPFVAGFWGGRPSATQMLEIAYASTAPWNESHWKSARFDQLLSDAKAETDESKRKGYIWELQAMLTAESGSIIPCFRDWLDAHNKKVGGHTPHSGLDLDNNRIAEKAFLKA